MSPPSGEVDQPCDSLAQEDVEGRDERNGNKDVRKELINIWPRNISFMLIIEPHFVAWSQKSIFSVLYLSLKVGIIFFYFIIQTVLSQILMCEPK